MASSFNPDDLQCNDDPCEQTSPTQITTIAEEPSASSTPSVPPNAYSRVRKRLKNLTLGMKKTDSYKNESKSKKLSGWPFKFCSRTNSISSVDINLPSTSSKTSPLCVCSSSQNSAYPNDELTFNVTENSVNSDAVIAAKELNTVDESSSSSPIPPPIQEAPEDQPSSSNVINHLVRSEPRLLQNTPAGSRSPGIQGGVQFRVAELVMALRNHTHTVSPYPYLHRWGNEGSGGRQGELQVTPSMISRLCMRVGSDHLLAEALVAQSTHPVHSQADFVHFLVPDLLEISNCSFYWGKMDRYEAEKLLDKRPEGTFLLRDSAQEEHLFSVSFRRFDRSLHARIEQLNNRFSFDSHDPGVYSSTSICGLLSHYKDPNHCMFFEPMLTIPLHRTFPFSLQHLSRATICSRLTYDSVDLLPLPKKLINYLKEYHYKQKICDRVLEM